MHLLSLISFSFASLSVRDHADMVETFNSILTYFDSLLNIDNFYVKG